ncbi:MAG: hypothetical protein P4L87_16855 [Formivibrio sp.]|nr:hypothetical protein [Formivibrio sp.]
MIRQERTAPAGKGFRRGDVSGVSVWPRCRTASALKRVDQGDNRQEGEYMLFAYTLNIKVKYRVSINGLCKLLLCMPFNYLESPEWLLQDCRQGSPQVFELGVNIIRSYRLVSVALDAVRLAKLERISILQTLDTMFTDFKF